MPRDSLSNGKGAALMIKMVIFDLDGTLVDSLTDLALSVNKGLRAAGLPEHPIGRYRTFVGNGRAVLIRRAMGDAANDSAKYNQVTEVFNKEYALHCHDNTEAYPGCSDLLDSLAAHGVLTAVLSNKPDEFVGRILKKAFPHHTFAEAWGQKPEFPCKPDGAALHAMLARHGISPDDCVYIGDSDVDVFTAQNGGMRMAGVSWGFRGKAELQNAGAPFVADTAAALLEHLLRL